MRKKQTDLTFPVCSRCKIYGLYIRTIPRANRAWLTCHKCGWHGVPASLIRWSSMSVQQRQELIDFEVARG